MKKNNSQLSTNCHSELDSESKKVPKLRFKEFSGEWEEKKIGNIGSFQGGGTPTTSEEKYWTGDIPWISSSDIIENDIKNINVTRFINESSIKESATKLIPKGSILFVSRVGVGKLAIAYTDLCTSQDFTNLTLNNDNSYFIGSYFLSRKSLLERYSQGTSIKGFTTGDLKTLKLNIPVKPEQQKIASFLTSVDKRIENLQLKIDNLKLYKKGLMQKIFSQEIRFKADDGSEFPEWVEKKLGDFTELNHGDGDWILSKDITSDGEHKIVQLGNIGLGTYIEKDLKTVTDETFIELKGTSIQKGDLLINRMVDNNLNSCIFNLEGKYITSVDVCWIRENKYFNNYFLMNLMITAKSQQKLLSLSSGSGRVRISKKNLFKKFTFELPCLEEQTKIANFLSAIDSKIEQVTKQLEHTKEFKKGLLQQMFV